MGLRVQITGPDNGGSTDLQGLTGTIIGHIPWTGDYLVAYYDAKIRYSGERYLPPESIELIEDVS